MFNPTVEVRVVAQGDYGPVSVAMLDQALLFLLRDMRREILERIEWYERARKQDDTRPTRELATKACADIVAAVQKVTVADIGRLLPSWGVRDNEGVVLRPVTELGLELVVNVVDGREWLTWLLANLEHRRERVFSALTVLAHGKPVGMYMIGTFSQGVDWVQPVEDAQLMRTLHGYVGDTAYTSSREPLEAKRLRVQGSVGDDPFIQLLGRHGLFVKRVLPYQGGVLGAVLELHTMMDAGAFLRRPGSYSLGVDGPLAALCRAARMHVYEARPDGLYEIAPFVPEAGSVPMQYGLLYLPHTFVSELLATSMPVTPLR